MNSSHSLALATLVAVASAVPALSAELFVRANQLGYRPHDPKLGIAFSTAPLPGTFTLLEGTSRKPLFERPLRRLEGTEWGEFKHHAELDFSGWAQPGTYRLRVGEVESWPFLIRHGVYDELPDQLLEFMRQQRCGYNPWLDAVCHSFDGRTAYGPLTNGSYVDARGGWHDAADLLKYLLTSGNATAQMLLAFQLTPGSRTRDPSVPNTPETPDRIPPLRLGGRGERGEVARSGNSLHSPKTLDERAGLPRATGAGTASSPGARHWKKGTRPSLPLRDYVDDAGRPGRNGLPDLLDEARWGLEWMLKLHPAPDHLYHQVADDRDHIGRRLPQNEIADYGWGKGGPRVVYFADGQPQGLQQYKSDSTGMANLAGRYAVAMALAHQVWAKDRRFKNFAARCLQAGREVYEMGRAHEGAQQGNSVRAPYRYEETTWADDMEWGAAELFRATGEQRYLDDAKHYAQIAADESWMGKDTARHYQHYPFMNLGHFRLHELVGSDFKNLLAGYYRQGLERCARAGERNPYRIGVPFIWCSNNLTVALATQALLYERMTGDSRYRVLAAQHVDWLLGRNPWGYTMLTGVGQVSPRDPHLMTQQITGRSIRGGLVDGPVYESIFKSLRGVSITEPDPLARFQGPAVFHDDVQDYSSNEPTMDGTASAILLWALCAGQP